MTMTVLLIVVFAIVPVGIYYYRQWVMSQPRLQWPVLAKLSNLQFEDKPPRLSGKWNGWNVAVDVYRGGARVAALLPQASRLRIEIGPREEVTRRAGMVVPDPVLTGDHVFEERLLARCSDKAAGLKIMEPALRQRLFSMKAVEILGKGQMVQCLLPELRDPDSLDHALDILTVIAEEMMNFPAGAAAPQ